MHAIEHLEQAVVAAEPHVEHELDDCSNTHGKRFLLDLEVHGWLVVVEWRDTWGTLGITAGAKDDAEKWYYGAIGADEHYSGDDLSPVTERILELLRQRITTSSSSAPLMLG